ncbi:copper radical oxidase [Mycena floridula]|nr:copper radical oxidase [Mycena floridula]
MGFHIQFSKYLLFLFVLRLISTISAAELAWNGHTTPGSTEMQALTPFYIPPGTKGYRSTSPMVKYKGDWKRVVSPDYVGGSQRRCSSTASSLTFTFSGTGIELYCPIGPKYGSIKVYIDSVFIQLVHLRSKQQFYGQRCWFIYTLALGKHTVKISNAGGWFGFEAFVVYNTQNSLPLLAASVNSPTDSKPLTSHSSFALQETALSTASSQWTLHQEGSTGVNAMQIAIVSETHAIILDKVEHNPLTIDGHPAWGALYDLNTHDVKALDLKSNSFCAGSSFLSNGTFVNVGGNPVDHASTSPADFGEVNGLQSVRLFDPCDTPNVQNCDIVENPRQLRTASARWYSTVVRLPDGSAMIIGGSKKGGWINNATVNNPTIEFYPHKSIHGYNGLPIPLPFLNETLFANLFPIAIVLDNGEIFIAGNTKAIIYNLEKNTERKLPDIPNGVRITYPMSASAVLLPLSASNSYASEVMIIGGSAVNDTKPSWNISSQDPASSQCIRLLLTKEGIKEGWKVQHMPEARVMPDAVLLPDGKVLITNGAGSGIAGYGNVQYQIGASNADNPVLRASLYDPSTGKFSKMGMPTSDIPRLYHSVATLTPKGNIMIAGSNPNLDRSEVKFGTEYRVEWLNPPYMQMDRPVIEEFPKRLVYGKDSELRVKHIREGQNIQVALMDLGTVTHALHTNSRCVYLVCTVNGDGLGIHCTGPPNSNIYPPGPAFVYLVIDGVPSEGKRVMVGKQSDNNPPVDEKATEK